MSKRSPIWLYFSIRDEEKKTAQCDVCKTKIGYKYSVSNLKKHFFKQHPNIKIVQDKCSVESETVLNSGDETNNEQGASESTSSDGNFATEVIEPMAGPSKQQILKRKQETLTSYIPRKISTTAKHKIDNELLGLFIFDYQPFSVVEDRGFRNFVNHLNPSYSLPTRQTISNTLIPLEYEKCYERAKEEIKKVVNICLTTDCWTSVKNEGHMAITGHYIDNNFKMSSILLSCDLLEENHTTLNLASRFRDVLKDWQLEKKVILVVSDNARNIKCNN